MIELFRRGLLGLMILLKEIKPVCLPVKSLNYFKQNQKSVKIFGEFFVVLAKQ